MRLISVENIKPDMELAKPIYHKDRVLLNTHCTNLSRYKNKLLELGINHIYITDDKSEGIEVTDVIDKKTRRKSKKIIKESFQNITNNKKIKVDKISNVTKEIVEDITHQDNILVNLIDIKSTDSYTFEHSVNVAVLSLLLGRELNYTRQQLIKLGIGALLHDIGKVAIPEKIIKKPAQLTDEEYEIIKKHPSLGYENIKGYYNISPLSRTVILSHHEKVDGTGYPKGFSQDNIHEFGRLVAITDVFDALTSDRCYRDRWPINKAVNFLISKAGEEFDSELINKFVKTIAIYPNGSSVKLSTGEKAIVERQNRDIPTRPVVRIITDETGEELEGYKKINLKDELDIVIVDEEE
ncbi:HD-GYP domain-containing protein [Halanaerocella petrolearia]